MRRPKVTVVVANYNGAHLLPECLESLRLQRYEPLEIIVADGASVDDSRSVAERFQCQFVSLDQNRGLGTLYNRGALSASGELLFFVNNDMKFEPDCVMRLVETLESNPDAFAADPLQYDWEGHRVIHARTALEAITSFRELVSRTILAVPPVKANHAVPCATIAAVPWGCAGSLMVRRKMFDALAGWDESFFLDMEDVDLCWRAWMRGWSSLYVPEARLYHKWGASNDDQLMRAKDPRVRARLKPTSFRRLVGQQRNHLRVAAKVLELNSVLTLIVLKMLLFAVQLPRRPRVAAAIARALGGFVTDIPSLLRSRRLVASTATCSGTALIRRFINSDVAPQ